MDRIPKDADGHSLLPLSTNHFLSLTTAPGARSASLATRRSARGAVAPSGPLRSPVPVSGERLVGCRARRLLSRSPGRRPGARGATARRAEWRVGKRAELAPAA